ncbi:MAG: mannosyltransferase family protein [Acidimicrobiales bacterium]
MTRVIVLASLGAARFLVGELHPAGAAGRKALGTSHAGLMSWDAAWYQRIAEVGYAGSPKQALRFFPLFPLLGRAIGTVSGISDGAALILLANVLGLLALVLLHALVSRESLGSDVAARSIWVVSLWPAAFVLVMGYSEALLLCLSIAAFLCWRTERLWWSAAPAYLAGLCRPVGLLLAVPALVEAICWWRSTEHPSLRAVSSRLLSVAAAPVGAASYLAWVAVTSGSFTEPLREQLSRAHRGGVADPIATLFHDAADLVGGHDLGTALHAPFAVAFVVLTAYLFFRLPASYGWYAAATMAVAITAPNLDSLERYGLACFPLAIAVACLTEHPFVQRAVLSGLAASLAGYALLAFLGLYVP